MTDELVLTELLAVVGGHDQKGIVQNPLTIQFVEKPAQGGVEVGDAVVVVVSIQLGRVVVLG
jgi:hypothetical protein